MKRSLALMVALSLSAIPFAAAAGDLTPVPSSLSNRAGVVCVKVTNAGNVRDAFVVASTGDDLADADMIDYVKGLKWPKSARNDPARNTWQPVVVRMGRAPAPDAPSTCAPPLAARQG